jgi:hypothetical protein
MQRFANAAHFPWENFEEITSGLQPAAPVLLTSISDMDGHRGPKVNFYGHRLEIQHASPGVYALGNTRDSALQSVYMRIYSGAAKKGAAQTVAPLAGTGSLERGVADVAPGAV